MPGLYLVEAEVAGHPVSAAGLVVRDDGPRARLVVVQSNLTWAAYSTAGQANLYRGPAHVSRANRGTFVPRQRAAAVAARAYGVSLRRPTQGPGLTGLLAYDVPLAELADRFGLAVDHLMDTDVEVHPSLLTGHAGIVIPGHSEYWTTRMYDALTAERNLGVNIANVGANAIYWHARVATDALGDPRAMTVYRSYALDSRGRHDPALATVRWSDEPLSRPSSAVLGETYVAALAQGALVVHKPPAWLVAGTGARDGTVLPDALLNEADGALSSDRAAPANLQVVAEGVLRGGGVKVASSSYYSDRSGAGVFSAGSTTWLCGALGQCLTGRRPVAVPRRTATVLLGVLRNLLRAFAHPRWGATHPSYRDVPRSGAFLLATLPADAVGTYGRELENEEPRDKPLTSSPRPTVAPAPPSPSSSPWAQQV